MCLTCNPDCGRCHPPPKRRPVQCPDCGATNAFEDGNLARTECSFCGGRLPEVRTQPTVRCRYTGLLCSEPCGRAKESPPKGAAPAHCEERVAPLDAAAFAKTLRHGPSEG